MHHAVRNAVPRRAVLGAAAAAAGLAAAGCSSGSGSGKSADRKPAPSVDHRLRERGAAAADGLLARYDATLRRHPDAAPVVGPLRAEAVRQAAAFRGKASASPSPQPSARASGKASPKASASPGPGVPPVPADRGKALAALAAGAREASDARLADLGAASPDLARLIASVSASWAGHALVLGSGA